MPSFDKLFFESKGQPIAYHGNTLVLADKFPVRDGDILVASIEKSSGDRRQGLCIDITGHCEFEGKEYKVGKGVMMQFWADTAPKEIKLKIFTKRDFVWVKNIWESIGNMGRTFVDSGHHGAAMIVEEIDNGRRYRCNDGTPDDDFDDIVFTIKKLIII